MESIAFFGKGGIGKSTISSNISVILSKTGRKILHVGCDPKIDSTISLAGRQIIPFSAIPFEPKEKMLDKFIVRSPFADNLDCIEAGGPGPGVGCAGIATGILLDALKYENMLSGERYDGVIYDAIGDIVCGGFAAPLKKGFAKKMVIISSEETQSLFAANNLLRLAETYMRNGVYVAGIIFNIKDERKLPLAKKYAECAGLNVLGILKRDPLVYDAAKNNRPAVLMFPNSNFAKDIAKLTIALLKSKKTDKAPKALETDKLINLFKESDDNIEIYAENREKPEIRKLTQGYLLSLNLKIAGLDDGSVLLTYFGQDKNERVVISPKASAHPSMRIHSDWCYSIKPKEEGMTADIPQELMSIMEQLDCFSFKDFINLVFEDMSMRKSFFGIIGHPTRQYHGLPYTVDSSQDMFKYASIRIDRNTSQHALFLLDNSDEECRFNGKTYGGVLGQYYVLEDIRQPRLPSSHYLFLNSELTKNVITGENRGFSNSLNLSCKMLRQYGEHTIECNIGCFQTLLGDDSEGLFLQAEENSGIRIYPQDIHYVYSNTQVKEDVQRELLLDRMSKFKRSHDYDVCLVDFGTFADLSKKMLEERGIRSTVQLSYASGEPASASLQVLFKSNTIKKAIFHALKYPFASDIRPFGFENTRKWLEMIIENLAELGTDISKMSPLPSEKEIAEEKEMQNILRNRKVAFILTEDDLPFFLRENQNYPASSVFAFMKQTNMSVILIIRPNVAGTLDIDIDAPNGNVQIQTFSDEQDLSKKLLEMEDLEIVYSDVRDDQRLLALGKIPFSLAILKPGYYGAIETLRRFKELLRI